MHSEVALEEVECCSNVYSDRDDGLGLEEIHASSYSCDDDEWIRLNGTAQGRVYGR